MSSDISLEREPNRLRSEAHGLKKIFINAVISVLDQGNVVQNKKRRDQRGRRFRRLDKTGDAQAQERPLKNESCDVEDEKTHREIQFPCRSKTEESLFSREFEETRGQSVDLTKNCPQGNPNVPLYSEDQSSPNIKNPDTEVESNVMGNATSEPHSGKRELEDITITENTPRTSTKDRCSRRRRSFDRKLENKVGESGQYGRHGDAAGSQTRQRSHVSESDVEGSEHQENSERQSASVNLDDHSQNGNKTKGSERRGESRNSRCYRGFENKKQDFSHCLHTEPRRHEVVRNHQDCNDNKTAKCSDFNRNSKNGSSKNERDLAVGNQRRRKSTDGASRKDIREIDRSGNPRSERERKERSSSQRGKSSDDTSEKDSRERKDWVSQREPESPTHTAENNLKGNTDVEHHQQSREKKGKQSSANNGSLRNGVREDHLGHPRENRTRRIASDSGLKNYPSENRGPCWTNRRTHSESDIREEYAEGKLKPSLGI